MAAMAAEAEANALRAAAESASVGDVMPDGSLYAGLSPTAQQPMFAMPADAGLAMTFNEAAAYTRSLNTQKTLGHQDWRLPDKEELKILIDNRSKGAFEDTYDVTGLETDGDYHSSTTVTNPTSGELIEARNIGDGSITRINKSVKAGVRCIRTLS